MRFPSDNEGTRGRKHVKRSGILLPVLFALLLAGGLPVRSASCDHAANVLVVNSYHSGFTWSDSIMDGMRAAFAGAGIFAEFFVEYLDTKRFPDTPGGARMESIRRNLAGKYKGFTFDLILSSDDNALRFLLAWGETLFPGVPVVFCGVNTFEPDMLTGRNRYTGVLEVIDQRATIDFARRLYPEMKRLAVVIDATVSAAGNRRGFQELAREYPFPILFVPAEGAATPEQVAGELAAMPEGTVVYYSDLFQGDRGSYFLYQETLPILAEACPYPIFTHSEYYIGFGVVGGMTVSGREQGYEAGNLGVRVLQGADPSQIPLLRVGPNRMLLDYRVLRRFGISDRDIPLEAELVGEPDSFWYRNRRFLLRIAALILAETTLLVVLFINILHRRRMQRALAEREEDLRVTLGSIGDAVIATDAEGRVTRMNHVAEEMTGWKRQEALGRALEEVFPIFSSLTGERAESPIRRVFREGTIVGLANHTELRARDGSCRQIADSAAPIRKPPGEIIGAVMVFRDVTEEYRTEQERKEQNERLRRLLDEREVMLREIHHRVKNNLQIISSMLRLQSFSLNLPDAAGLFLDSQNRIRSMALVHELLYQTENLAQIDMKEYFGQLIRQISEAYGTARRRIRIRIEAAPLSFPVDLAIPCGLLLTELYSNSLKHAFPDGREGEVTIVLCRESDPAGGSEEREAGTNADEARIVLRVQDNGIGFSETREGSRSLGLQLVDALVGQIRGRLEIVEADGTSCAVRFPEPTVEPLAAGAGDAPIRRDEPAGDGGVRR